MDQNKYVKDFVECINEVRQNPAQITDNLKFIVDNFDAKNKTFKFTKDGKANKAIEPVALWKQTIDYLKKVKKLPAIQVNENLQQIGQEFLQNHASTPELLKKPIPFDKLEESVLKKIPTLKNHFYRFIFKDAQVTPLHQLLQMIVDDGDKKRTTRMAIFDKDLQNISVSCQQLPDQKIVVLILISSNGKIVNKIEEKPKDQKIPAKTDPTKKPGVQKPIQPTGQSKITKEKPKSNVPAKPGVKGPIKTQAPANPKKPQAPNPSKPKPSPSKPSQPKQTPMKPTQDKVPQKDQVKPKTTDQQKQQKTVVKEQIKPSQEKPIVKK